MACISPAAGVIVCGGAPTDHMRRRIVWCPFCQCHREMVAIYAAWYDTVMGCTGCGDSWEGGYLNERPFRRGWRKSKAARYREMYAVATFGQAPDFFEELG